MKVRLILSCVLALASAASQAGIVFENGWDAPANSNVQAYTRQRRDVPIGLQRRLEADDRKERLQADCGQRVPPTQ